MLNKNAISPVVATALLLVVAVVAVVGFSGWFQTFSSNLFVDVEQRGSISSLNLGIETLVGNTLYVKAGNGLNITTISIDGNDCDVSGIYYNMSGIDVSDCLEYVSTSTPEIVLVTDRGVSSKVVFVSGVSQGSSSLSSTNPRAAPECYTAPVNTLGSWPGCQDMLIVNRSMLNFAISNNYINGDVFNGGEDYYIEFGGQNYTFGDSDYNIFVGQVTDMSFLFSFQYLFVGDINYWDTSNVITMFDMFNEAIAFNQSLNNWNTSSVTNMEASFWGASSFNLPLSNWDTSSVTNMRGMFEGASFFNQDISSWNVSSVTDMSFMFFDISSFDQNLSSWDVSSVTSCTDFNLGATSWSLPKPNLDISCIS